MAASRLSQPDASMSTKYVDPCDPWGVYVFSTVALMPPLLVFAA